MIHLKKAHKCILLKKEEIANGIFDFTVESNEIAKEAQCGQFLHIDCGSKTFLRRPISICDVNDNKVRFIFQVKGEGTKELSQMNPGDVIDIMGPLGHGYEIIGNNPVIIGGGIGVFPLLMLAKRTKADVFLGFRDKSLVVLEDEFENCAKSVTVGTDNGTYGYKGYVASAMEEYLHKNECDMIYCCGPTPMLKAVKNIAESLGIKCQLSLEQRMGCGIGACLVCTCETVHEGTDRYMRVCKNGPVFYSTEVTLND